MLVLTPVFSVDLRLVPSDDCSSPPPPTAFTWCGSVPLDQFRRKVHPETTLFGYYDGEDDCDVDDGGCHADNDDDTIFQLQHSWHIPLLINSGTLAIWAAPSGILLEVAAIWTQVLCQKCMHKEHCTGRRSPDSPHHKQVSSGTSPSIASPSNALTESLVLKAQLNILSSLTTNAWH